MLHRWCQQDSHVVVSRLLSAPPIHYTMYTQRLWGHTEGGGEDTSMSKIWIHQSHHQAFTFLGETNKVKSSHSSPETSHFRNQHFAHDERLHLVVGGSPEGLGLGL